MTTPTPASPSVAAVVHAGDRNFDEVVAATPHPVLVDFSAAWCGPCRQMEPVLAELARDQADVLTVVEVDVDASPELTVRYGVMSMPTFVVLVDGEERARFVGARGKAHLLEDLSQFVDGTAVRSLH